MEREARQEIISKLAKLGLVPYGSRLFNPEWRLQNSVDSESPVAQIRISPNEIWLPLKKQPQKLQRCYYPSGKVSIEQIRDLDEDDDHFTDSEFFRWHESGNLQSLSIPFSKDERQFVSWNEDGEVSHRTIDRKGEPFERIVCLNCGDHTLIDGIGNAGFGDSGYLYNDSGRNVFRWDANDPAYREIVGNQTFYPWLISRQQKNDFENRLKPLPDGSRFRFSNFARCGGCAQTIASPLPNSSWLMLYDRTIWTDSRPSHNDGIGKNAILLSQWLVPQTKN